MDHRQPAQLPAPSPAPRRFVYRSPESDTDEIHPLRRSTDTTRPVRITAPEPPQSALLLNFRVYMNLR